jgi:hypothetical protein
VTRESRALVLEEGVFTLPTARAIAESLKRSADSSRWRKAGSFQSAMSMLSFYVNRAGSNLPERRRNVLNAAKVELRRLYAASRKRSLRVSGVRRAKATAGRARKHKSRRT